MQDELECQLGAFADPYPSPSYLKIKVPLYANYDEMLEVEKPDSVVAATSNQMHTPAGIACGNLGTHILMESPYLKLWKWVRS